MNNELSCHVTNYTFSNTNLFLLCCHLPFHAGLFLWRREQTKIPLHSAMNLYNIIQIQLRSQNSTKEKAKLDPKNFKQKILSSNTKISSTNWTGLDLNDSPYYSTSKLSVKSCLTCCPTQLSVQFAPATQVLNHNPCHHITYCILSRYCARSWSCCCR